MIFLALFAIIVGVPLYITTTIVAVLFCIGVLWSPFAGLICGFIARRDGRSFARYTIVGMIASLLFFWPWVYIVRQMNEYPLSVKVIRILYVLLFIFWIGGPVILLAILGLAGIGTMSTNFTEPLIVIPYAAVALLNIALCCAGKILLPDIARISENSADGIVPNMRYVLPPLFAFVSTMASLTVLLGHRIID